MGKPKIIARPNFMAKAPIELLDDEDDSDREKAPKSKVLQPTEKPQKPTINKAHIEGPSQLKDIRKHDISHIKKES